MSKCLWCVGVALLILGAGVDGAQSFAKPPDLPVDLGADFEDGENTHGITLGFDLLTGNFSLSLSVPWSFLQNWLPESLTVPAPAAVEVKSRTNGTCPPREARTEAVQEVTLQGRQARTIFDIAERCRKNGDLDMARTCYEEAHLLAPQTRIGRRAIQRLADIDSARSNIQQDAEEQEPREPVTGPRD